MCKLGRPYLIKQGKTNLKCFFFFFLQITSCSYPLMSMDFKLQGGCSPSDLFPLPSLLTLILELWENLQCWQNGWKIKR